MSNACETSDARLLDLICTRGSLSVTEAATATEVTATAVRQRLNRLMKQGLVERVTKQRGRGRPEHRYSPTEKAKRQAGNNYADLAQVLWKELRNVKDDEIRRGLLQRIADQMTQLYRDDLTGTTPSDRMESLREVFADRRVPLEIAAGSSAQLPVLRVVDCPYPELAAQDRSICAMEKQMFESLVEQPMRLSQCRLDGHDCCQFETK
jgi:DeoR family suf operon transcriptional repressor